MASNLDIDIAFDTRRVKRFLTQTQRTCLPRATRAALNNTMRGVTKTDTPKVVQANLNITRKPLAKRLRYDRGGIRRLRGLLLAKRDTLHLTDFKGTSQNKRGVGFKISRNGSRELLKSAFIKEGKNSGKKIVFRRRRSGDGLVGRYPIKARKGPSVGSQIERGSRTSRKIVTRGTERWAREFTRRLDYELNIKRCGQ